MERLFGSIRSVLDELGPSEEIHSAVVFAAWNQCAGELLRTRTEPVGFAAKRLTVAVEDKTWQRHLEDLSPQMLVKLNHALGQGTVRFIDFRIDQKAVSNARRPPISAMPFVASETVASSLVRSAASIADEQLRKTFIEAAGVYLGRAKQTAGE